MARSNLTPHLSILESLPTVAKLGYHARLLAGYYSIFKQYMLRLTTPVAVRNLEQQNRLIRIQARSSTMGS